MKLSIDLLRYYLDDTVYKEELNVMRDRLTSIGLEVEELNVEGGVSKLA